MTTKPALGKTKKPNTKAIKSTPKSAFIMLIVNMMRQKKREQFFPQDGDVGHSGGLCHWSVALASTSSLLLSDSKVSFS